MGAMRSLGYDNIGTVEKLMARDGGFSSLEVNTRLQVEHGVTEDVAGVDLVAAQLKPVSGYKPDDILPREIGISGHAVQARVYAEDPKTFMPAPSKLETFRPPADSSVRVDSGYKVGLGHYTKRH